MDESHGRICEIVKKYYIILIYNNIYEISVYSFWKQHFLDILCKSGKTLWEEMGICGQLKKIFKNC